jgi:hypothetical protein
MIQEQLVRYSICQRRRCHIKAIVYALACLGAVSTLLAVVPAPDGGYPGRNTAEGVQSLFALPLPPAGGADNTAIGFHALFNDVVGDGNTATGSRALANTLADFNTADGFQALINNNVGIQNTGIGNSALMSNLTGNFNTAVGTFALANNIGGASNIALGDGAGFNLNGSNNIDIGNPGVAGESATIRIGTTGTHINAYMAGIWGTVLPVGMQVYVDATGHLGYMISSARFKEDIKAMDKVSESVLGLKPVTFRYKTSFDLAKTPQFGLVAEDVAEVNPDLVIRDQDGKPLSVRYEAVNAMLLNEFLKAHRKIQEQEGTITELKSGLKALTATVEKQAVQIQKVSKELVVDKLSPSLAANN